MLVKALLIDLEGTLYFKNRPIAGAKEAIAHVKDLGIPLRFLTNTDSKTPKDMEKKLQQMGFDITEAEIFTPVTAMLRFFQKQDSKNGYFLVSSALQKVVAPYAVEQTSADYVVVGDFRDQMNYQVLNKAFQHIMAGAEIIALQKGKYFIRENGYNLDTGSFVQMLEYASNKEAYVLGKPSKQYFSLALDELGVTAEETAVVGDDQTTDILGAEAVGATGILVKTGKYAEVNGSQVKVEPNKVIDSISQLPLILKDI